MPRPIEPIPLREALDRYLHQRGGALHAFVRSVQSEHESGHVELQIRFGYRGRRYNLFIEYPPRWTSQAPQQQMSDASIDDMLYDRIIVKIDQHIREA